MLSVTIWSSVFARTGAGATDWAWSGEIAALNKTAARAAARGSEVIRGAGPPTLKSALPQASPRAHAAEISRAVAPFEHTALPDEWPSFQIQICPLLFGPNEFSPFHRSEFSKRSPAPSSSPAGGGRM